MALLHKYPRTQHLEGSRLQPGDEDLAAVPFARLWGSPLVVEEKIDGANAALSFAEDGELLLQSRGHFLTGGGRERHFALLKSWAAGLAGALRERLGYRYVVYGEWVYAKHTIYYDALPHFFLEFDVLDTHTGAFLSTPRRRALLAGLRLVSVPVLHQGTVASLADLVSFVRPSLYKRSGWRDRLKAEAHGLGLDPERIVNETDGADEAEGLYLKVEEEGRVTARYKWIRPSFLTAVLDAESHWLSRPIVPNRLAEGVDLFAGVA